MIQKYRHRLLILKTIDNFILTINRNLLNNLKLNNLMPLYFYIAVNNNYEVL